MQENVISISRNGILMDEMIVIDPCWYDFTLQWNESFYNWTSEIASGIGLSDKWNKRYNLCNKLNHVAETNESNQTQWNETIVEQHRINNGIS